MELSNDTVKNLANMQTANIINDDTFGKLLEIVVAQICERNDVKNVAQIYGSKPDIVKRAFADLLVLFVEAARHDLDGEKLYTFLNSTNVTGNRAQKLCDVFVKNKSEIQHHLAQVGNSLPHIVDASWRLDYCIKSSTENTVSALLYHIQLSTKENGQLRYVKFTCTAEQLQDLVYKLKEAVRHVEKIANL